MTGEVWIDEVVAPTLPSHLKSVHVSFAPGARTNWHTHPLGQTLNVLSGVARVQLKGDPVREIHPGDTVVFAPDEVHWHGAAPDHMMVHLAMQETDANGSDVTWLDAVTDDEYNAL